MSNSGDTTGNTIGARLAGRENNFDALRLLAAFAVVCSHAYPIREGNSEREPYFRLSGYCSVGEISVAIFFIISGLLVARSFLSDPNAGSYLKKRLLRILPGLVACVAVCAFVVGPWFTTLSMREYLHDRDLLKFARNALLLPGRYGLPGVFDDWGITDPRSAINGSLWSLPLEFMMYLAVLGLGMTKLLRRAWCVGLVAALLLIEWLVVDRWINQPGYVVSATFVKYHVWVLEMPHLAYFFLAGTLLLLFKDSVVVDWRWGVLCLVIVAVTWHTRLGYFFFSLCLPYLVMWMAFARIALLKPVLQSVTKWGDFSYGVYLYGYPVEQILSQTFGQKLGIAGLVGLSCIGTLLMAVLSWHLVERPFLKLKKRSTRVEVKDAGFEVVLPPKKDLVGA
jgi:peptidoglycan/LPS O-acetylase OafA/YrhL